MDNEEYYEKLMSLRNVIDEKFPDNRPYKSQKLYLSLGEEMYRIREDRCIECGKINSHKFDCIELIH